MNKIEQSICQAIDIIASSAIEKANYDTTIQGTVLSCEDSVIGKYKIKYQDSIFYAYSNNNEVKYNDNTDVYILVPNNDFSKDKTILGTTKKLGTNYITTVTGEDSYNQIGVSCITSSNIFGLCSYYPGKFIKTIYNKNNQDNDVFINKQDIDEYIKNTSLLKISAEFKTELSLEQQFRGNYGILISLDFLDNATGAEVVRNYILDVNKIIGNPYKLTDFSKQYSIFSIDGPNFIGINSISIFCYDFPKQETDSTKLIDDIFIKNLEMCSVEKISDEELANYNLTILTPDGVYFDESSLTTDSKRLQAQLRVKGNIVNYETQNVQFYWFAEDLSITTGSFYFNSYGGAGWKCLNSYNIIQSNESGKDIIDFQPDKYEYIVKKTDVFSKQLKFKCVVIYEDNQIEKEIIIKNYSSKFEFEIVSDSGTDFYFDIGNPTLTCIPKYGNVDDYAYVWAIIDNINNLQTLSETEELNNKYNQLYNEYNQLLKEIENEQIPLITNKDRLEELKNELESYNTIMRVEKNIIHNVDVSAIVNFSTYKCAIYYNNQYIGTAEIKLSNKLETEPGYDLVINNGNRVFEYNEDGVSPISKVNNNPITLKPLSFVFYNNLGQPLEEEILKTCEISWTVPTKDTMLIVPSDYKADSVDLINNTATYKNLLSFSYSISNLYNRNNYRNEIVLEVKYKDIILKTSTNFTFVKEGESGTNGTDFVCKIIPNTKDDIKIPVITEDSKGVSSLNFTPIQKNIWFNVQIWTNGEKIFESNKTGNSLDNKPVTIVWNLLANEYTSSIKDESSIEITDAANGYFNFKKYQTTYAPANIVKAIVTYDNTTFYATIPITTIKLLNDNYKVEQVEFSGFDNVMYSSDGKDPKYRNINPFEIRTYQKINSLWEDITEKTAPEYIVDYNWNIKGNIYEDKKWISSINLKDSSYELPKYQKNYKPLESFDGQCVTNCIEVIVFKNQNQLAKITIPIYLFLNRYGNSAINGWDGNSVSINEDGGFILSPQVGAGIKEKDNSFTGVVVGKVKESDSSVEDIGLIGYAKGKRSIFLDSQTGKSIFGTNGKGQMIIDPTNNKAELYSGNYKEASSSEEGSGLLIDLTTPEIKFGTKNFEVNKDGYITAKGGGSIAGWSIDNYKIYKNNTGLSSVDNISDIGVTKKTIKLPSASTSSEYIDTDKSIAFWAGNNNFFVSHDGYLKANEASIGNGTNPIFIGKSTDNSNYSALFSGKKNSFSANSNGFYLGTDGIAIGPHNGSNSAFQVTNAGQLIARTGYIGNGSNGWEIGSNYLKNGNKNSYNDSNSGVYLGTLGIGLGANFNVSSSGSLTAKAGNIGGWTITSNRLQNSDGSIYVGTSGLKFGSNFSVTSGGTLTCINGNFSGTITSSYGKIGGWTINGNGLTNGTMYIYSNGSIGGANWSISANGYASFSNMNISGGSVKMGGTTLSGSGLSMSSGTTSVGGKNIGTYVEDIVANKITANYIHGKVSELTILEAFTIRANSSIYIYNGRGVPAALNSSGVSGDQGTFDRCTIGTLNGRSISWKKITVDGDSFYVLSA